MGQPVHRRCPPERANFAITSGTDGAPCPPSPLPYTPNLIAGSTTDQAGGYTDFSLLLQVPDDQQRTVRVAVQDARGPAGDDLQGPAVRRTRRPNEGDLSGGVADRAHDRAVRARSIPAGGAPAGTAAGADLPDRGYEGAPYGLSIVVPLHVGPFTLQNAARAGEDRSRPADDAADGHDRSVAAVRRGDPDRSADDRRGDRQARVHVQPDRLRLAGRSAAPRSGPKVRRRRSRATSRWGLVGRCCSSRTSRSRRRGRPRGRMVRVLTAKIVYPTGELGANQASSPVEYQERQSRTAQAAAVAVDDAAEGVHRGAVRREPRRVSRGVGRRACDGDHAGAAGAVDGPGVFRLQRQRIVPEPDRRAAGLRRHGAPGRGHVHQQAGDHEQHVQAGPRRADRELRTEPPRGPLLGARRQREPLQDASSRCRPHSSRRTAPNCNRSTPIAVTGCPKAKKVKKAADKGTKRKSGKSKSGKK